MAVQGPTLVRKQLGRRLRQLRDASGLTERQILAETDLSKSTLYFIEQGLRTVKRRNVRELCRVYQADASVTEALVRLADGTGERGWWEDFSDILPAWFRPYIGLEAAADRLMSYEPDLVHSLLQTVDYATVVFQASHPDADQAGLDRHLALLAKRQRAVFDRDPAIEITALLGEGVLAREVGSPELMAGQIQHLRLLRQRAKVDIRILPWTAGAHPAMTGGFALLAFNDPLDPTFVYLETQVGAHYLEDQAQIDVYRNVFDHVGKLCVPIEEHLFKPSVDKDRTT
ncbi:helix-turn-helix domain-containing protein [Phytohabitans kaempferiae]|uniref:Helix-turn-helix domain-containing protein n=1 Tax=Phytohabitans kaempferiae TaxID=1620943 RepID=A0ABV6MBM3_9ACTN